MKPRGPLMIEHKLIEKMIEIIKRQIAIINTTNKINPLFIDITVDFIKTYADRTHHGKEEDILFRDLRKKNIKGQNANMMNELIEEHQYGRKMVKGLVEAKERYLSGQKDQLKIVSQYLQKLVDFYPNHIKKEDEAFFPNTEKYFSSIELDAMLKEFWEFDRKMIHEKYKSVLEDSKIHLLLSS